MRRTLIPWLVVAACGAAPQTNYDYAKEPDPRKMEYVIGVADSLAINVWRNPELSTGVNVRPDGMITMPLIGDLPAVGRTPTQLREDIVVQLGKYIRDEQPVVTIAVTGVNSYAFTVTGNVEKPGNYSSTRYVTVLEAVQMAGGPNRFASPDRLRIIRRAADGKLREIPVNYGEIVKGKRADANLPLLRADVVFMP